MDIFEVIWPVLLVGAAAIAVRVPQSHVAISQTMKDWTLPIALVLVDIALLFILPLSRRLALEATRKAVHWQMILLVFGVFALRGAFQISGADRALTEGLNTCNIPSYAVAFAAPLAISIVCGYNMAGVSMAFPLLQGIFLETGPAGVAVAYAGSFLGILASPVHLCLVLSREYYHANWGRIYRGLLPLILCMLALTLITALVG
jgi:hypothetical protein